MTSEAEPITSRDLKQIHQDARAYIERRPDGDASGCDGFVKKYFPDFSSLQIVDRADLIIWDYVPPTPISQSNFFGHYIYGILERQVHSVIQNRKVLMNNFSLTDIDETKINNYIYEQGKRLVESL